MKTPTNIYLVSLSIADLTVLIAAVPNELISYYIYADQWIWNRTMCKVFIWIQYSGINAASLFITAFTVERYIAICHPIKAQKLCTIQRAKKIIAFLWVIAISYDARWVFHIDTMPLCYKDLEPMQTCNYSHDRHKYIYIYGPDLVAFYLIPLIVSCVLYGLMARVLFTNPFFKDNTSLAHNLQASRQTHKGGLNSTSYDPTKIQVGLSSNFLALHYAQRCSVVDSFSCCSLTQLTRVITDGRLHKSLNLDKQKCASRPGWPHCHHLCSGFEKKGP